LLTLAGLVNGPAAEAVDLTGTFLFMSALSVTLLVAVAVLRGRGVAAALTFGGHDVP
jgi:hypothetical protein